MVKERVNLFCSTFHLYKRNQAYRYFYDDMLIIDDLGTEYDSKFNVSHLFELINERSISDRKIIINTNLNFSGLEKKYTKRVTSRLTENFLMMFFYGEDIRRKKFLKKED